MAPPRNSFAERLGKDFAPLYVISGDEHLLVTETADAIRTEARNRGFTDRKVFTFDSATSFKWANVHREAASMSLFGDKPFIEVIFRTTRLGRDGAKEIGAFLETVSPDSAAMFVFPRFDAAAGKTAWAKELKDKTVFIPISPVTREQLPAWITERLKQQNQKITPEAATFMCEHVEGNLLAAHQEILKLGLLFPEGELSLENVSSSVMNVSRFDVFQTTESLLAGDAARYAKIITALKAEDAPAPLILWLIAEEIRTLIRYSDAVK
ncbi:MAG: DNA polymerase III subunit delta, partial [Thermoguttaceae bacterium]|nr:DNA polymerase III subunit delta [Thermoguttaceae bacterium]